nr:hypothetical protein [Tanacetum cinerariifolium]
GVFVAEVGFAALIARRAGAALRQQAPRRRGAGPVRAVPHRPPAAPPHRPAFGRRAAARGPGPAAAGGAPAAAAR